MMKKILILVLFGFLSFSAALRAEKVPGAKVENTRIMEDGNISVAVKTQFLSNPILSARTIGVDTTNGLVSLTGAVASVEEVQKAIELARSVDGVRAVNSSLTVSPVIGKNSESGAPAVTTESVVQESGQPVRTGTSIIDRAADRSITATIESRFAADDLVKGRNIHVDTANGTVILNGTVSSEAEQQRALDIAQAVDNVVQVQSKLRVQK